ncbi:MAG: histone deacetylase family protein, partial [Alphaproteobacteria bacterium]
MTTGLFTHPACLDHRTPPGHPECVERLEAVLARLREDDFTALEWFEAKRAQDETVALVHPAQYVEGLKATAPAAGFARIDADTAMSPGSLNAAYYAAGAVCDAVDAVVAGDLTNAFCAIRPPGHH